MMTVIIVRLMLFGIHLFFPNLSIVIVLADKATTIFDGPDVG